MLSRDAGLEPPAAPRSGDAQGARRLTLMTEMAYGFSGRTAGGSETWLSRPLLVLQ